jgi:hypothetical protein
LEERPRVRQPRGRALLWLGGGRLHRMLFI